MTCNAATMVGEKVELRDDAPLPRWAWPVAIIVLVAALALRIYALGRLPGLNGDEAWYGAAVQSMVRDGFHVPMTPSSSFPGLIQLSELALLQSVFPPSVALLRVPTVISSLLAIWLAYLVGRRLGGSATGLVAALLMASLPINIVYARFGWDPSHSGLLILLALYCALKDRILLSAFVAGFSLFVHSTNVFAIPFLVAVYGWEKVRALGLRAAVRPTLIYAALVSALPMLTALLARNAIGMREVAVGAEPVGWLVFFERLPGLFTGDTVFRFIVGDGLGTAEYVSILLMLLIAFSLQSAWRFSRSVATSAWIGPALGLLATILATLLLAGADTLRPHSERYAFAIVAPAAIFLGMLLVAAWGQRMALTIAVTMALLMLSTTVTHYLVPLDRGAANAPMPFWTWAEEPKAEIARPVAAWLGTNPDGEVYAENYWIALPVRYLTNSARVIQADESAVRPEVEAGQLWIVYRGSDAETALAARADAKLVYEGQGTPADRRLRAWEITSRPTAYSR